MYPFTAMLYNYTNINKLNLIFSNCKKYRCNEFRIYICINYDIF